MSNNTQYEIINGNVIMEYSKFCDFVSGFQGEEIGQDIEKRSYMINDSEVAYDAIRAFLKKSKEQLNLGNKVVFTKSNGEVLRHFEDIKSFHDWAKEFFAIPKHNFIKVNIFDKVFEQ